MATAPASSLDGMKLIDIGCNLAHRSFPRKRIPEVLDTACRFGVEKVIVTGTSVNSSRQAAALVDQFPARLYFTAGVHPHDAKTWNSGTRSALDSLLSHPSCVAVGECGLDYNRNFSTPEDQRTAFREQLKLACEVKKPLFVHERDAFQDMVTVLEEMKGSLPPVVIHCFTGSEEKALTYIAHGFYIGLTGSIFKAPAGDNTVLTLLRSRKLPLDRLMLETDAPFMTPNVNKVPGDVKTSFSEAALDTLKCLYRRNNQPCTLRLTVEYVAHLMGLTSGEVAEACYDNTRAFFGLS